MGLIAFSLGGVPVYSYGLIVLGAILLGSIAAWLNIRLHHENFSPVPDMLLWGLPLAIILGRLGFVLHHFERYTTHLWSILTIWQGGFSLYGAIAGFLVAVIGVCRVQGRDTWQWLDMLIPSWVLALVVIELGIFALQLNMGLPLSADMPNDHSLAEYVEYRYRPLGYGDNYYYQPIALYQAGLQLVVFLLLGLLTLVQLRWHRPRTAGCLFLFGTACIALIRFGCGFFYLASGADMGAMLPLGRIMSGMVGLAALIWLWLRSRVSAGRNF